MLLKLFLEWPLKGVLGIVEKITEQLELELDEEEQIKKEMVKLNLLYEMGQIDEQEYQERQLALLKRLEETPTQESEVTYE
ncbi:MAG: gas vesicle protein GvpG [Bacillota bacterium]